MPPLILVADHDPNQRQHLAESIRGFGYEVETTEETSKALTRLQRNDAPPISLIVLDLTMPTTENITLKKILALTHQTPVIVATPHGPLDAVISATEAGALDFLVKPVAAERLLVSIKNALAQQALKQEVQRLHRYQKSASQFQDLVSCSENTARALRLAERAANSNIPVMIEGETGVGKEQIARAIHNASDRKSRAFISFNCASLTEETLETKLFGREKNPENRKAEKYIGKIVEANSGTLYLEEIGKLSLPLQVKLLRVLQEGEVEPIGARRPNRVDIRLICSTQSNIINLVKCGRFREDLFYRLNVFPITLAPLRARKNEIPDLARKFMAKFSAEEGRQVNQISSQALDLLMKYEWPGNIRQFENAIYRAVILAEKEELDLTEFPQIAARVEDFEVQIPPAPIIKPQATEEKEFTPLASRDPNIMPLIGATGEIRNLADIEENTIRFALYHYHGQMSEIARRLGIGRSTLYRKLKEYGIEEPGADMLTSENILVA